MVTAFFGGKEVQWRKVLQTSTRCPGGAAKSYTLTFPIPDLIRREVKLNEKDDSIAPCGRRGYRPIRWASNGRLRRRTSFG